MKLGSLVDRTLVLYMPVPIRLKLSLHTSSIPKKYSYKSTPNLYNKMTYDPTAKAEALSRLLGALRQEAEVLAVYQKNCQTIRLRWKCVLTEIAYLEIVLGEWQKKDAQVFAEGLAYHPPQALEEIPPNEETKIERPEEGPAGKETPQPFLTPERSQFVKELVKKERKAP